MVQNITTERPPVINIPPMTSEVETVVTSVLASVTNTGAYQFGLFGTCGQINDPWRVKFNKILLDRNPNLQFYSPDKGWDEWRPYHANEEKLMVMAVHIITIFMSHDSRSPVSLLEAIAFSGQGLNVHFAYDQVIAGTEIEGQVLSQYEAEIINETRALAAKLVLAFGGKVYNSLDEMAQKVPADYTELYNSRRRYITPAQRTNVRKVIKEAGYEHFLKTNQIEIANDPFLAIKELMIAMAVAYASVSKKILNIVINDPNSWKNLNIKGIEIIGRLFKDCSRASDPYAFLLVLASIRPVHIIKK